MSRQQNEIIPMKKQLLIFLTICCFPFMLNAQMPERTPENIGNILNHLKNVHLNIL